MGGHLAFLVINNGVEEPTFPSRQLRIDLEHAVIVSLQMGQIGSAGKDPGDGDAALSSVVSNHFAHVVAQQ